MLCGCGQHGCWEVFASSTASLRYYKELNARSKIVSVYKLLQLADEGDAMAIAAISRQAAYIGRGLRLVTAALAPEVILIAGDLTTQWSRFGPIIQIELEKTMLAGSAPTLGITKDGELSRLRGAAAVVLQRHSGYNRSSHPTSRNRSRSKAADAK
jgi:predicted NBD/HSP70 family sugar kinase